MEWNLALVRPSVTSMQSTLLPVSDEANTNKFTMKRKLIFLLSGMALVALPASAAVVSITAGDLPGCDVLAIPSVPLADELGDPYVFPVAEQVSHSFTFTTATACVGTDNPSIDNLLVSVTNLQAFNIADLYYVVNGGASPGTFSNFDGDVSGSLAMKVDTVGVNRPLISESMTLDGIFEAGETWKFIVQDYQSTVPVDSFFSPGVVGGGDVLPSLIVPEPAGAMLGLLGGLLMLRRRR